MSAILPASQLKRAAYTTAARDAGIFQILHPSAKEILGSTPRLHLLATADQPVFHEAGVWFKSKGQDKILITSTILKSATDESVHIQVCNLTLPHGVETDIAAVDGVRCERGVGYERLDDSHICMANGATKYDDKILLCTQGQDHLAPVHASKAEEFTPSALVTLDPRDFSKQPIPLLNNFHGRVFNSLNDVFVHTQSGCVLVTDPDYGFEQKFKGSSQLPNATWSFMPSDGSLRMVADGIAKPNGVVCSPDGKTCYITDTDYVHGDGSLDPRRPGTIYAFEVQWKQGEHVSLCNKRVFALVDCGAPDGIKCDTEGNVYTGCFDGVHIFNPSGRLLARIVLPRGQDGSQRGCANLVFGPPGRLIILSETTVWEAIIEARGALGPIIS